MMNEVLRLLLKKEEEEEVNRQQQQKEQKKKKKKNWKRRVQQIKHNGRLGRSHIVDDGQMD